MTKKLITLSTQQLVSYSLVRNSVIAIEEECPYKTGDSKCNRELVLTILQACLHFCQVLTIYSYTTGQKRTIYSYTYTP